MQDKFKVMAFYASLKNEEVEKGLIFRSKETKYHQRVVDINEFASMLENAYNEFDGNGYDVVNVVPLALGSSEHCVASNGNYLGDVGFSITRGALVVGKKRDN
jgi:hypothetical protein